MYATSLRAESSRMSAPAVVASPAGPSTSAARRPWPWKCAATSGFDVSAGPIRDAPQPIEVQLKKRFTFTARAFVLADQTFVKFG